MSTPIACPCCDCRYSPCKHRPWTVRVYGFGDAFYEVSNAAAARYAAFKDLREAGWFTGRDGFHRYLVNGVSAFRRSFT